MPSMVCGIDGKPGLQDGRERLPVSAGMLPRSMGELKDGARRSGCGPTQASQSYAIGAPVAEGGGGQRHRVSLPATLQLRKQAFQMPPSGRWLCNNADRRKVRRIVFLTWANLIRSVETCRIGRAPPAGSLDVRPQAGKNNFYGRAETLQITPNQLELLTSNGAEGARWVEAFTLGYERTLFTRNGLSLFGVGSYTNDVVPTAFRPGYGSDPAGAKLYMRIKYMGGREWF